MNLKRLVKSLTTEALEIIFEDALKRGEDANARIISDEVFERRIGL